MDIFDATTGKEKTRFIDFAYEVYRDTPAYRDNLGYTGKNFVYQRDSFSRRCRIKLVLVRENGAVAARCAYIAHPGFDAAQIALFEALPDKREAVDLIKRQSLLPLSDKAENFTEHYVAKIIKNYNIILLSCILPYLHVII
jgi:hypothetical protein